LEATVTLTEEEEEEDELALMVIVLPPPALTLTEEEEEEEDEALISMYPNGQAAWTAAAAQIKNTREHAMGFMADEERLNGRQREIVVWFFRRLV